MSATDGKIDICLDGKHHHLACSWRAVEDIQNELGLGFVPLARRIAAKAYGLRELSVIVRHGLIAAGAMPEPRADAVAELVFKTGLLDPKLIESVTTFCEYALNGGRPPAKAPAGKPPAAGG